MLSLSRSVWNTAFQLRADYIKTPSKKKYPPVHRSATRVHSWLQAGFKQTAWGYRPSVCGENETPPGPAQISSKPRSRARSSSRRTAHTPSCWQSQPFCLRQHASQPGLSWLKKTLFLYLLSEHKFSTSCAEALPPLSELFCRAHRLSVKYFLQQRAGFDFWAGYEA